LAKRLRLIPYLKAFYLPEGKPPFIRLVFLLAHSGFLFLAIPEKTWLLGTLFLFTFPFLLVTFGCRFPGSFHQIFKVHGYLSPFWPFHSFHQHSYQEFDVGVNFLGHLLANQGYFIQGGGPFHFFLLTLLSPIFSGFFRSGASFGEFPGQTHPFFLGLISGLFNLGFEVFPGPFPGTRFRGSFGAYFPFTPGYFLGALHFSLGPPLGLVTPSFFWGEPEPPLALFGALFPRAPPVFRFSFEMKRGVYPPMGLKVLGAPSGSGGGAFTLFFPPRGVL